ncbi:hypothetical protein [Bacillus sp. SM2101]|uniref:hypothetical protein n=1 Tax=Bacillus sp. SM2101 TaxID=2805366 RepID=UPI001BDEE227|nr:hypothetical protein [Bacillus sp. SM2101]
MIYFAHNKKDTSYKGCKVVPPLSPGPPGPPGITQIAFDQLDVNTGPPIAVGSFDPITTAQQVTSTGTEKVLINVTYGLSFLLETVSSYNISYNIYILRSGEANPIVSSTYSDRDDFKIQQRILTSHDL